LDAIRVEVAVDIHKPVIEELLQPGAFLREEAGCPLILPGVFEIDGLVGSIEVPGNDDFLAGGMQSVA
jgi:hypothetical protein